MIKIYGEKEKGKQPPESAEMITFVNHVRREYSETYGKIITHIRNEGKKTNSQVSKQKAEGMTTGASDIISPGCPAFVCEMKSKSKSSRISTEQQNYLEVADKLGSFACVVYGHKAAINAFEDWIIEQR